MTASVDATHDPALGSWVESANDPATDFPIQNLPFGRYRDSPKAQWRVGVAIGDRILDLLQGADDPYGPIAQIRAIEARTPEPVASLILEDCRHSPHLEQPQATLGAAVRFCAQIAEEAR